MIKLTNLSKNFSKPVSLIDRLTGKKAQVTKALDQISLEIHEGETLGLVGESGSGKSTLGRIIAGLMKQSSGEIKTDLKPLNRQMIFQDAASALNSRMNAGDIIAEAPKYHGISLDLAILFTKCGLDYEGRGRYPHQFSGGQRTRLGIARALAVKPKLLIADEAVASLDVSIQAQILNLLIDLKREEKLTLLFISHDLSVIGHIADRVAVMYLGRIVEIGTRDQIFNDPKHPYTQALLAEIPVINGQKRQFQPIKGEIPSPLNPPKGCHFHTRCEKAFAPCFKDAPKTKIIADQHQAACHLVI